MVNCFYDEHADRVAWKAASDCLSMCGTLHVGCLVEDMKAESGDEVIDHD